MFIVWSNDAPFGAFLPRSELSISYFFPTEDCLNAAKKHLRGPNQWYTTQMSKDMQ